MTLMRLIHNVGSHARSIRNHLRVHGYDVRSVGCLADELDVESLSMELSRKHNSETAFAGYAIDPRATSMLMDERTGERTAHGISVNSANSI